MCLGEDSVFDAGRYSPAPAVLLVLAISKDNTYCISSNAPHSSLVSGFQGLNCPKIIWRGWSGWIFSFSTSKRINNIIKLLEWDNALVHQVKVLQQFGLYAIETERNIVSLLGYLCLTPSNWLHFNYYLLASSLQHQISVSAIIYKYFSVPAMYQFGYTGKWSILFIRRNSMAEAVEQLLWYEKVLVSQSILVLAFLFRPFIDMLL